MRLVVNENQNKETLSYTYKYYIKYAKYLHADISEQIKNRM